MNDKMILHNNLSQQQQKYTSSVVVTIAHIWKYQMESNLKVGGKKGQYLIIHWFLVELKRYSSSVRVEIVYKIALIFHISCV
jgi:hypothetical protein